MLYPLASSAIRNWAAATGLSLRILSDEHAWQLSQEFRLASNFSGPLNFSVGGNYLHYETEENYYVFINTLTMFAAIPLVDATHAHHMYPACHDNQRLPVQGRFSESKSD